MTRFLGSRAHRRLIRHKTTPQEDTSMRKLIESTLVSLDGVIDLFENVDTS